MKIKFPSKRKIVRFFKKIIKIIEVPEEVLPFDYVREVLIKECLHADPFSGRGKVLFNECLKFFRDRTYKGQEQLDKNLYIELKEWAMLYVALVALRDEPLLQRYNDVDFYGTTFNSFGRWWYLHEAPRYYAACKHLGICFDRKPTDEEIHKLFVKAHKGRKLPDAPERLSLTDKAYAEYKVKFPEPKYHIKKLLSIAELRIECAYPGQKLIGTSNDNECIVPPRLVTADDGYVEELVVYGACSYLAVYEKTDLHIWDVLYPAWGRELREGKRQYRKD